MSRMILADLAPDDFEEPRLLFRPPAGASALRLRVFQGSERISGLSTFDLDVRIEEGAPPVETFPALLVNKPIGFGLGFGDRGERWFHGIVSRATTTYYRGAAGLHLEVVPTLWRLTLRSGFQGFENMSTPEVVKSVLREAGIADVRLDLRRKHPKCEYAAMHDETEFEFFSRLLEASGIAYHFEHEEARDTLVLTDANEAFSKNARPRPVRLEGSGDSRGIGTGIHTWRVGLAARPATYTGIGRDPLRADRCGAAGATTTGAMDGAKVDRWLGAPADRDHARACLHDELARDSVQARAITGSGRAPWFCPGLTFRVESPDRPSAYLLTAVNHSACEGGDGSITKYENTFSCIPAEVEFRPRRSTPRPFAAGVVTARVMARGGKDAPDGSTAAVDEHGRVRIQYWWDQRPRRAQGAATGSCWARLSQGWTGSSGGGAFVLPRAGAEVVVAFDQANPNDPVIVGAVYHSRQPAPLPTNVDTPPIAVKIPSLGERAAGRGHDISVDVRANEEQLTIRAPGAIDVRADGVVRDRAGGARHVETQGDYFERVAGASSIQCDGSVLMRFAKTLGMKVVGALTHWIGGDYAVHAAGAITIGSRKTIHIRGERVILSTPGGAYLDLTAIAAAVRRPRETQMRRRRADCAESPRRPRSRRPPVPRTVNGARFMNPMIRKGDPAVCFLIDPGPKPHVGSRVAEGVDEVLAGDVPVAVQGGACDKCTGASDPTGATLESGGSGVLIAGKPAAGLLTSHQGTVIPTLAAVLVG